LGQLPENVVKAVKIGFNTPHYSGVDALSPLEDQCPFVPAQGDWDVR